MRSYMLIQNDNICPIEGFTLLGVSTARGQSDKIGQFGSGNKLGMITLLRAGISPIIFLGNNRLEFFAKEGAMGDTTYRQVWYRYEGKEYPTSMTLEFGAIDWTELQMGLREFVSNALDNASAPENVKVKVGDFEPEGEDGFTKVYIPASADVTKFYAGLRDYFLQFNADYDANKVLLVKNRQKNTRLYRLGVFVRELNHPSLFDYNFGEVLKIDECRNLNDYSAREAIANYYASFADMSMLEGVISLIHDMDKSVEGMLSSYSLTPEGEIRQAMFKQAFTNCWGSRAAIYSLGTPDSVVEKVKRKGFIPVFCKDCWYQALMNCGVQTVIRLMGESVDKVGREIKEAPKSLVTRVTKLWNKIDDLGMAGGKKLPQIKTFIQLAEGQEVAEGYYEDGVIFIEKDCVGSKRVIIQQLGRHATGGGSTYDLLDWTTRLAAHYIR